MGDYGAKGSVAGFDVKTVVDYLQLFNSSWPLLKIGSSDLFTGTVTHNLGYPPFHFLTTSDGRVNEFAGLSTANYGVDSSTLARSGGVGTPRYYICRLDLTTNYEAPIISGGTTQQAIETNYGFKISKPGKDINSTDMRDFSLHSGARSLMVQKVSESAMGIGGTGWELTVPHGLSYVPEVFVFMKPGTNNQGYDTSRYMILAPPVGAQLAYYTVDNTNVFISASGIDMTGIPRVSVVVLKDPLAKQVINVSYP